MVKHLASEAATPLPPVAPVVKRKRRASCLGEQERRERKRAIDREAQRSLREKTKTHIAELERTIQILRDKDQNGATASLLSEIDGLRAENERLRDVIDSVKNVIGCDITPRTNAGPTGTIMGAQEASPATSAGHQSPKPSTVSFTNDAKPGLPTPIENSDPFDFQPHGPKTSRPLDLDGMMLSNIESQATSEPSMGMELNLECVAGSPEKDTEELPWGNDPATATWAPLMAEFFGLNWRCPSPIVLHIGSPDPPTSPTSNVCPTWKKSNELFGKVFSYRSTGTENSLSLSTKLEHAEPGLLYLGIQQGWDKMSNEWMQSPALVILQQVDELLFKRLPHLQRLAVAYKSYKLLKYYLDATREKLEKVPEWLRPSLAQSSTKHPIAIDFFAWPTLRQRLIRSHNSIFSNSELSKCYSQYIRFDWPFTFEDAFFLDSRTGLHVPSPLFERYHRDLKYWVVDPAFYEKFPEMMNDIEGDRRQFSEEIV